MSPPAKELAPPKTDSYTAEQLKQFNGNKEGVPIYVAIKGLLQLDLFLHLFIAVPPSPPIGTVFDVSERSKTYGPGCPYHCFTGKDASRALGLGSLKEEDLLADYSTLDTSQLKVLDDWYTFFSYVSTQRISFPAIHLAWELCPTAGRDTT